ncbi:hypothetical protein E3V55_02270 [Candidatus Marinimicrobia bacterium MT.SAG.3]|nr:hypothetical protein E3V55_02270 [Candidatus Marinimicrobia bacterium MT.SAG.3]
MRKIFYMVLLSIVLGISFNSIRAQKNRELDQERLVNDIRIMEGIIDKLLTPSGNTFFSSESGSQGFYLPDYGVIFAVPVSKPFSESLFVLPRVARVLRVPRASGHDDGNDDSFRISFGFDESEEDKERTKRIEEKEKKELERISSKVRDFLGIYADAIGQLNERDKIAIYLFNSSNQSPEHLFYVLKKDIIEFRSGKIKSKTFKKRIKYSSLLKNDDMRSQIDIMAYVLNTSLNASKSGAYNFRMSDNGVNGLYLDGFGALFIVNRHQISSGSNFYVIESQLSYANEQLARIEDLDLFNSDRDLYSDKKAAKAIVSVRKKDRISARKKAMQKEMEEYRKSIEEYKLRFSTLIGNYGHTLRLVNDTEWIGVLTNWQNLNRHDHNSGRNNALIMKVLKRDVNRYNSGRISKEDFFKKIGYTEY